MKLLVLLSILKLYARINIFINNDDEKARDHCHITSKFRGAAQWKCNINFQLTKKISIIFHNLKGYDSHLNLTNLM